MNNYKYLQPFVQACKSGVITCSPSDLIQYWQLVDGVLSDHNSSTLTWNLSKSIMNDVNSVVSLFDGNSQSEECETILVILESILIDFLGKPVHSVRRYISDSKLSEDMMDVYTNVDAYAGIEDTIISLRTLDRYRTESFIIKS